MKGSPPAPRFAIILWKVPMIGSIETPGPTRLFRIDVLAGLTTGAWVSSMGRSYAERLGEDPKPGM